ncbi:hypothetical protein [Streptomyces mirabilis]|uniref:hypothetical protein n=1 Tax=Streptomyces mirabilis TaxID=68239 RepID=UPI0036B31FA7
MFERVGAEESAALESLAWKVRNELAAAGLPVLASGMNPVLTGGAGLRACASRAFRLKQLDEPVLRHSSAVGAAMTEAMAQVLASAGFSVEDARDEYRPQQLRVLAGPPSGQQPVWQLRDDELALPGWQDPPTDGAE